ncbi:MAG: hypothetical protein K0R15_549 [Clostridiales bacterium]|jgi:hypothetical protein|nr:hypothetical protein [Clostridiales bacterium]
MTLISYVLKYEFIGNYNFGYTGRFQFWGDVYLISDSKIKKIEETDFYGI